MGTRLSAWLKWRDISQRELQRELARTSVKVTASAINAWVKNRNAPKLGHLEAVQEVLGITMLEFYGKVPSRPRKKARSR